MLARLCGLTLLALPAFGTGVALAQGPPAHITVALSPASIPADGHSTSTVTVTVTDASGNGVPGQTIAFAAAPASTVSISAPVDNGNGTYTATATSSTTPGNVQIFAGDVSPGTSIATTATLTLTAPTTISLAAVTSSSPPVTNQGVTLVATVTSSATSVPPAGTVAFDSGGVPIGGCGAVPALPTTESVTVTCGTSFAAAASPVALTAAYTPTPGSLATASTSVAQSLPVASDRTSTSVAFAGSKAEVNTLLRFVAVVTPSQQGPFVPGGAVEFKDHGRPIAGCTRRPVGSSGMAACAVSYASPGQHSISATYLGTASFAGSSSLGHAPVAVQALGTVNAHMQWVFYYTPKYTQVLSMTVHGAPRGARVVIKCRGAGCPFARRALATVHGAFDLSRRFRHRHLAVGARITVEIVKPGWIGRYFTFTMIARHGPRIGIT